MSDGEKILSQSEIDALAGRLGQPKTPAAEAQKSPPPKVEDDSSHRPRGDRTLSQDEIDAILLRDYDTEAKVEKDAAPTQKPPPEEETITTKRSPTSKKAATAKITAPANAAPTAEDLFLSEEISPTRGIPRDIKPQDNKGAPSRKPQQLRAEELPTEGTILAEEIFSISKPPTTKKVLHEEPYAEDLLFADEAAPPRKMPTAKKGHRQEEPSSREVLLPEDSPISKKAPADRKTTTSQEAPKRDLSLAEEILPVRKATAAKEPPAPEDPPSEDSFVSEELAPFSAPVKEPPTKKSPPIEDIASTADTYLTEELTPPREPRQVLKTAPKQPPYQPVPTQPQAAHEATIPKDTPAPEPSARTIPSWLKARAQPLEVQPDPAEKKGLVDRLKQAIRPREEDSVPKGILADLQHRLLNLEAVCEGLAKSQPLHDVDALAARLQTLEGRLSNLARTDVDAIEEHIQLIERRLPDLSHIERGQRNLEAMFQQLKGMVEETDIRVIHERLDRMQERLDNTTSILEESNIEDINERLTKMQKALDHTASVKDELITAESRLDEMQEEMSTLNKQLETIIATLKDSLGFGLHKNFICKSCGSKGYVALTMKCTQCGKEGWMGWWPERR